MVRAGDNKVILFGGWAGRGRLNMTWAYDPAANTWAGAFSQGRSAARRSWPAVAYDPGTRRVIMFGGRGEFKERLIDTGHTIPSRTPGASSIRRELSPLGVSGMSRSSTPVWQGHPLRRPGGYQGCKTRRHLGVRPRREHLTELDPGDNPQGRATHAMAYDPAAGGIIVFGGVGAGVLDDTWLLGD